MNYRMIGRFMSRILLVEVVFMIPALLISVFEKEWNSVKGFAIGMLIILLVAVLLSLFSKGYVKQFYA